MPIPFPPPPGARPRSGCRIARRTRGRKFERFAPVCAFFLPMLLIVLLVPGETVAQEPPYFVTSSAQMEDTGTLGVEMDPVFGTQRVGNDYLAGTMEFEYGATRWWTSEVDLDGQSTFGDSTIFTGWTWENRFRPIPGRHWINPVFAVEYQHLSGADKSQPEVVGFDSGADYSPPNAVLRPLEQQLETRLILSSDFRGWDVSENFISEKGLGGEDPEPWGFGYTAGVSRWLGRSSATRCLFCRQNFGVGAEFYGGLGTVNRLTLSQTSHYAAGILAWHLPSDVTLKFSPGFGLTGVSRRFLFRWGISYDLDHFGGSVRRWFR